jgi:hypothetical protein
MYLASSYRILYFSFKVPAIVLAINADVAIGVLAGRELHSDPRSTRPPCMCLAGVQRFLLFERVHPGNPPRWPLNGSGSS